MKFIFKSIVFLILTVLTSCGGSRIDQQVILNHPEPLRISKSKLEALKLKVLVFTKHLKN